MKKIFFLLICLFSFSIKPMIHSDWDNLPQEMKLLVLTKLKEEVEISDSVPALQTLTLFRRTSHDGKELVDETLKDHNLTKLIIKQKKDFSGLISNKLRTNLEFEASEYNIQDPIKAGFYSPRKAVFNINLSKADLIAYLLQNTTEIDENPRALLAGVLLGNPDIVKLLLKGGAPINIPTAQGENELMYAAKQGNAEIVKLLISWGAKIPQRGLNEFIKKIRKLKHIEAPQRNTIEQSLRTLNQGAPSRG